MSKMFIGPVAAAIAVAMTPATVLAQSGTVTCGDTYTVSRGDTISKIAKRAYGNRPFAELYEVNKAVVGPNPNMIFIGQDLAIPCAVPGLTLMAALQQSPAVVAEEVEVAAEDPAGSTVAENLVFTFNKTSAPKFIINSGIVDLFIADIAAATEGRIQFVDPEVMNRDPEMQFDLVTSGAVDAAYVFNGHLAASHPLLDLPMIPLMGGSAEQTAVSLWNLHDRYLAETGYFDDAKLLGFIAAPAAHIWRLSDEPVVVGSGIADMNNYAVPYFVGLDTKGPAAVQAENVMQIMAQNEEANGTLTFFMAHGAARAAGIWNENRTVTEVENGLYTPTFSMIMSNEAWDKITPEDQAAIEAMSGAYFAHRSASWDAFDAGHRLHMLGTGLNIARASDALLDELGAVSETRANAWAAEVDAMGGDGQAALAAYRADLASMQDKIFR